MDKNKFPYIALSLGLFLFVVVLFGSQPNQASQTQLPLLLLLTICELAFFVTAIGAYIGFKQIISSGIQTTQIIISSACVILSLQFLLRGISLWPE